MVVQIDKPEPERCRVRAGEPEGTCRTPTVPAEIPTPGAGSGRAASGRTAPQPCPAQIWRVALNPVVKQVSVRPAIYAVREAGVGGASVWSRGVGTAGSGR